MERTYYSVTWTHFCTLHTETEHFKDANLAKWFAWEKDGVVTPYTLSDPEDIADADARVADTMSYYAPIYEKEFWWVVKD